MEEQTRQSPELYSKMRAMELTHICARCEGNLVTIWSEEKNGYVLACAKDHSHRVYKRLPSATELLARGDMDQVVGPGAQKDLELQAERSPERFNLMPTRDAETGITLEREDKDALVHFAKLLGLNAWLGHVSLFYGIPRITVDGYYYLARAKGYNIRVWAKPATEQERKDAMVPEGDYFYIAHGMVDGKDVPEIGLGIVKASELTAVSKKRPDHLRYPIAADHPQRMAEKRAEWQLFRKLIPLEVKE